MISRSALQSYLKSRLHSRMIPFEAYDFSDGSAVVIVTLISSMFSVRIPYVIRYVDDATYTMSTPMTTYTESSLSTAISKLVLDMRKLEVKFTRWKK